MDILRFITCGSVDDGKSTLIGRLLYDSKAVSLDILNAIERQTKNKANGDIDLSLLTDGLRAEREQGITIDIAYKYFTTPKRKFIIADAPGHIQYTRNMVTGASNSDLAIVLIDARLGVIEQTRRHSLITSLLGIPHVVVAVNKMDLVGFDATIFQQIKNDYLLLADNLGLKDITFVPISALQGDNVVEKSEAMTWYEGEPLLTYLENVHIENDVNLTDARFQVQYVIRPREESYHDYRGYAGRIQSGIYKIGDKIRVLPSGIESEISRIEVNLKDVKEAFSGQAAVLHFKDDIDISRGDSIVIADNKPLISNELEANICWFDEQKTLQEGQKLLLQNGSNLVKAVVKKIEYKHDVSNLQKMTVTEGGLNDILKVRIKTARPIVFDNYKNNRATGAFILVNENTSNTVAAGMVSSENLEAYENLQTNVEKFQTLLEAGKTLEAIELYYDENTYIQNNDDAPIIGKQTIYAEEKNNLSKVKALKIKILSSVIDENQGLVLGEMQINITTSADIDLQLNEAFSQRWKHGKIIGERFYFKDWLNTNG